MSCSHRKDERPGGKRFGYVCALAEIEMDKIRERCAISRRDTWYSLWDPIWAKAGYSPEIAGA